MMEQQRVLTNEEFQNRWKHSVRVVCCVYRVFDSITKFYEVLKEIVDRLAETFHSIWDSIVESWNTYKIDFEKICRSYTKIQKKRPHRFHNEHYKVNTIGFKSPIRQCARSRC